MGDIDDLLLRQGALLVATQPEKLDILDREEGELDAGGVDYY